MRRSVLVSAALLLAVGMAVSLLLASPQSEPKLYSLADMTPTVAMQAKPSYDVIVVGTDPEGIAAAIAAARTGLRTLLVDGKDRAILGGLFTLGWLNSLDMNHVPGSQKEVLNKGLFEEWVQQMEGDSFDVVTAAAVFNRMVRKEKQLDLMLRMKRIEPLVTHQDGRFTVTGVRLTAADDLVTEVQAGAVIDATQDGDLAAASGAKFTIGREDLGDSQALMAVTPIFRLTNVTPEVWKAIRRRLTHDGDPGTGANAVSAWGYAEMWAYESEQPDRLRVRGLNIGRQNDGSALVNALQLFGVNGLDPQSRDEAKALLEREMPRIIAYMKRKYPEFEPVAFGGLAPELYVRETRHLVGEYRLTMEDLLEEKDHPDAIAYGSYEVDIQSTSPKNRGWVLMKPRLYAVPLRALIPQGVDGLLVVGRAASFDSLPHGSARVVPLGMATGQAAGAAARIALDAGVSFRELAASPPLVRRLRALLIQQGVDLSPPRPAPPAYMRHRAYEGLKTAVRYALVSGNYTNDFKLNEPSHEQRLANHIRQLRMKFPSALSGKLPERQYSAAGPLSLDGAAAMLAEACGLSPQPGQALSVLQSAGWIKPETAKAIPDTHQLTNGDVFLLIRDIVQRAESALTD